MDLLCDLDNTWEDTKTYLTKLESELAAAGIKLNAASSLGEATEVFHVIKQIKGQINKEQHVGPSPTSASVLVKRMCRDNEPLSKLCWLLFFIWCLCCPAPEICVGPSGMPELRQRVSLEALLDHCFCFYVLLPSRDLHRFWLKAGVDTRGLCRSIVGTLFSSDCSVGPRPRTAWVHDFHV